MSKIVDLTVTLDNNMPGHRFFPRPVILPQFTHDEMVTWGNGTPEDPLGGCTTWTPPESSELFCFLILCP